MSTRGPKPTHSTARLSDRTPPGSIQDTAPEPPASLPDQAHDAWREVTTALADSGALVQSDYLMLAQLAQALTLVRAYSRQLMQGIEDGETVHIDRNGNEHTVPFLGSRREKRLRAGWNQALRHLESLADDYALTPTARARLGVSITAGQSLVEALKSMRDDGTGDGE